MSKAITCPWMPLVIQPLARTGRIFFPPWMQPFEKKRPLVSWVHSRRKKVSLLTNERRSVKRSVKMHPLQMSARSKKENIKELLALGIQRGGSFFLSFNCTDQGGQIRPGFPCTYAQYIRPPPQKVSYMMKGGGGKWAGPRFVPLSSEKATFQL